jgi:hypothetical protein
MSSLPPYNPRLERAAWLFPVHQAAELSDALRQNDAGWRAAAVDTEALAAEVRRCRPGLAVDIVPHPADAVVPEPGWLLASGDPEWCEALLRHLMGMHAGTARFVLFAGAVSIVQVRADRAVLIRLNDGRALT